MARLITTHLLPHAAMAGESVLVLPLEVRGRRYEALLHLDGEREGRVVIRHPCGLARSSRAPLVRGRWVVPARRVEPDAGQAVPPALEEVVRAASSGLHAWGVYTRLMAGEPDGEPDAPQGERPTRPDVRERPQAR